MTTEIDWTELHRYAKYMIADLAFGEATYEQLPPIHKMLIEVYYEYRQKASIEKAANRCAKGDIPNAEIH
jgi:hypothetical protein